MKLSIPLNLSSKTNCFRKSARIVLIRRLFLLQVELIDLFATYSYPVINWQLSYLRVIRTKIGLLVCIVGISPIEAYALQVGFLIDWDIDCLDSQSEDSWSNRRHRGG